MTERGLWPKSTNLSFLLEAAVILFLALMENNFFIFTKPFHILVTRNKNFIALTLRKDVIGPLVSKVHASE